MTDAYATVDRDWRFTYVNAAFERIAGRGRETLVGKVCWDEFPDLRQSRPHSLALEAARSRLPAAFEEFISGIDRWLEVRLFPDNGGIATYIRDITERKRSKEGTGQETLADLPHRADRADRLAQAIERGEMFLLYQPQMTVQAGEPDGLRCAQVEALVRWRHAEQGVVMPDSFIPFAEETGLINPLGTWILREACRQGVAWKESGRPMRIAVNISPRQLDSAGFVETVKNVLDETGLPPGLLTLELTESALMRDLDEVIEELRALRALGVRLAMDDFGTGYSCLAYLRRFPLNTLKIDRRFIDECDRDAEDLAVVRIIIDLAHALALGVIAEGVERPEQMESLVHLGCTQFQGYLFHEPLEAERIERLFGPQEAA